MAFFADKFVKQYANTNMIELRAQIFKLTYLCCIQKQGSPSLSLLGFSRPTQLSENVCTALFTGLHVLNDGQVPIVYFPLVLGIPYAKLCGLN